MLEGSIQKANTASPSEEGVQEKRKHPRIPHPSAEVICYGTEFDGLDLGNVYNLASKLVDVGLGGVCIISKGKLRTGIRVRLDVTFPSYPARLRGVGVVRWACRSET